MSRKLLFAKGMLLCFLCHEKFYGEPKTQSVEIEMVNHCFSLSRLSALELIADGVCRFSTDETGRKLFGAYDRFMATMRDDEKRRHLKDLPFDKADDAFFEEQRGFTREFQDALEELFLDSDPELSELTRRYGVF